jgi:multisubunit Na+/H+ antiporter MnhF subunit
MIAAAIVALLITLALTLIRAFLGPNIYDQILAVMRFFEQYKPEGEQS